MNELLGWYGYDKVSEGDTETLDLQQFAPSGGGPGNYTPPGGGGGGSRAKGTPGSAGRVLTPSDNRERDSSSRNSVDSGEQLSSDSNSGEVQCFVSAQKLYGCTLQWFSWRDRVPWFSAQAWAAATWRRTTRLSCRRSATAAPRRAPPATRATHPQVSQPSSLSSALCGDNSVSVVRVRDCWLVCCAMPWSTSVTFVFEPVQQD